MLEVARRPSMWKAVGGSLAVTRDGVARVVDEPQNHFLEATCSGKSIGFIPFYRIGEGQYEMHLCLTEAGMNGIEACKEATRWLFDNTSCREIVAQFDKRRRDVRLFCGWAGFKVQHRDTQTTRMILRKE